MVAEMMESHAINISGEETVSVEKGTANESEIKLLRGRWELASVLNFLSVFERVIGGGLKLTAEEIELGLIEANSSNAQLHIALLKGIPPVSKTLNASDVWVTVLCRKLSEWWEWVAEGDNPLTAHKGEEITNYKELAPTQRLLILKALCEVRAEQDDTLLYINDNIKKGTQISSFRKDKIGGDGNGTSYWYDGNSILGYRLYKVGYRTGSKTKMRGKACPPLPEVCFLWETVATDLEGFTKVSSELISSKVLGEVSTGKAIEIDAIPVLQKLETKRERALKRRRTEERLLSNFKTSYRGAGITRSCRSCKPISYTFDEFDRTIEEAIKLTKKTNSVKEPRKTQMLKEENGTANGVSNSNNESDKRGNSADSEAESDKPKEHDNDNDGDEDDNDYDDKEFESSGDDTSDSEEETYGNLEKMKRNDAATLEVQKPRGSRWSKRLAGDLHPAVETLKLGTKNVSRQRPMRNSTLDSVVGPADSDDEISSEHPSSGNSSEKSCESEEEVMTAKLLK